METPKAETYTIEDCARCGGTHPVTFKPLTHPIETHDVIRSGGQGEQYERVLITHWAPCPTNGEPILMNIKPHK